MPLRTVFTIDSEALVVDPSSPTLTPGSSIINNSDTPNGTIFTYSGGFGTEVTLNDTDNPSRFNDDETDHVITDGGGIVANGQQVEAESIITLRALDINGNQIGDPIEITVFSQGGVTSAVWGFATDTALVPGTRYVKLSGDNDGTTPYSTFVACFEAETQILTRDGLIAAKDLSVGDLVWTRDDGYQPIRWTGKTTTAAQGPFAPVVFQPGSIGNEVTLVVSPEHRVLLNHIQAEILFGTREVLLAAKHLCGLGGVARREGGNVDYVHFMFDRHQIVEANGVACESFFLSEHSVMGMQPNQRDEIISLFPSLSKGIEAFGQSAAPMLKGYEAALLRVQLGAAS